MSYTADEQELYDFGAGSIPRFLFARQRSEEVMGAFVKMFDGARQEIEDLFEQTYILNATGTGSRFLDLHARERVGGRQEDETDEALRERIRNVRDQVTRPVLLDAAQAIIDAESISGTVAMLELKRDKGFYGEFTEQSGTGGTFAGTAPNMRFTPTTLPWVRPPYVGDFPPFGYQLVFSGAATGGNDGTFTVTGLDADAAEYQNATGAAEVDATVSWKAQKLDQDGNLADGFPRMFFNRGYRMGSAVRTANIFIMILPYGSTAATQASVEEMLRQRKGAGVLYVVERRLTPP